MRLGEKGQRKVARLYGQRRGNVDKEPQTGNNEVIVLARARERERIGRSVVEMTSYSENQVTRVSRPRIRSGACLLNQNFPHGMCPRNRKLAGFRSRFPRG